MGEADRRLPLDRDDGREAPDGAAAPGPRPELARSSDLGRIDHGASVEIAGMVIARQRPETANGITFMLLEDERGSVNLIVPPPGLRAPPPPGPHRAPDPRPRPARAPGRHDQRRRRPSWRRCEPNPAPPDGGKLPPARLRERCAVAELRAVAPAGHSFGRRGR